MKVMALLRRVARDKRSAVIAVTHDERMIEGFDSVYRMHDGRLARSRFNAAALDRLDAATARAIVDRISSPRTSADHMPLLRAAELPAPAVDRITAFLRTRVLAN